MLGVLLQQACHSFAVGKSLITLFPLPDFCEIASCQLVKMYRVVELRYKTMQDIKKKKV